MIVYKIAAIPDITLSKYQAYAESGVEGMIKTQLQSFEWCIELLRWTVFMYTIFLIMIQKKV